MRLGIVGLVLLFVAAQSAFAGTLDTVRNDKMLKVAYRTDVPPFSSAGGAVPTGFSIDLCRMIADRLAKQLGVPSIKVEFVEVTVKDRLQAIVDGRAHIECGATTVTLSRMEKVDFSVLFYITGTSLMTRADSPVRVLGDLDGRKLAVTQATTTQRVMAEKLAERRAKTEVVTVASNRVGLRLLLEKKVDAMAGDQAILLGLGMASGKQNDLRLSGELLSVEQLAFPLPRNDADFRLAVNRALSDIYLSGDVGRTWTRWFEPFGVKPTSLLLELYRLNSFVEK